MPNQKQDTPVFNVGKTEARRESNRALPFHTTYDANGNLTNDGVNTYTWNARNQMIGMNRTGLTASFTYDSFGRRVSKTVNGVTTKFLYDRADAVQEQNASGAATANMLIGGTDEVFSRTEAGTTQTFLQDGLGSTISLLDSNGVTKTDYSYEPFGLASQSGTTSNNSSKYTGREDDGTGLYYYRARYYSPSLQRFISEDSVGFAGGDINLYAYVGNNPINHTDPTGNFFTPDTLLDIAFIGTDIYNLATGKRKDLAWNLAALGVDIVFAIIPGATGGGPAIHGIQYMYAGTKRTAQTAFQLQKQARREAFREAGIGRNGDRIETKMPLNPGSQSPFGPPGERTEWTNPNNNAVVHHDPYGNYYGPGNPNNIGPHYGVERQGVKGTTHFEYKSNHDPCNNR